ncbi:MAG: sigma-54-dependent Fis family transcriptional regulator [Ignavibacteriae bacterium]|nr:sigma-54-dependent Fis family transcriptional regulator [Ignavibacteriota bacterium]
MSKNYNLLIVDDEEYLRTILEGELGEAEEFNVDTAADGGQAINKIQAKVYDVVLLDIKMPRVSGIEVLQFVQEYSPTTQVIILTNYADVKTAIQTIKLGAYDFIAKPYDIDELLNTIHRAIERKQLYIDNKLMKSELSRKTGSNELIGQSPRFLKLIESATRFADSDSFVLIQGASGSGKELIANLVHRRSPRNNRPFVAVNCASIPDSLLESELFGHEKGAFTNAYTTKQGLVEVANGGTLFLDEVGDISPSIQPKLLRFLETGEFRRVGGTNLLAVDVRVVCATNKDLREEVKNGRFREDLLYRLNVVTLQVPPLSERKDDIPILADYFLKRKSKLKTPKKLSGSALDLLMSHDWPGNIRELEHVLEGAVLLSAGEEIEPSDLSMYFHRSDEIAIKVDSETGVDASGHPLSLEELEKVHIERVLKENNYSRNKTADVLGISKKTLYLKIKRYGMKVED